MKQQTVVSVPVYSAPRKIADPSSSLIGFKNHETYEVLMKASEVPEGIPLDPNPRDPKAKGKVYAEIIDSLQSNDGLFHKKNKGMTIVVGSTEYNSNKKQLTLKFRSGTDAKSSDGILDGGHTYSIITSNADDSMDNQYVKATIMVGVPSTLIPELSAGLNNSTALNDSSKMNQNNKFEWIKESLCMERYSDDIIYFQNDKGRVLVEDIVAVMTAMNIDLYPVKGNNHPIVSYNSKGSCLVKLRENEESFQKLRYVLPDILELYDSISGELYSAYSGNAGLLKIFNSTNVPQRGKRRKHYFPFIQEESYYKLEKAVVMPVLSAFRTQLKTVTIKGEKVYAWKKDYTTTRGILEDCASELLDDVLNTYNDIRNINQLGKSNTLWSSLVKTLRLR